MTEEAKREAFERFFTNTFGDKEGLLFYKEALYTAFWAGAKCQELEREIPEL